MQNSLLGSILAGAFLISLFSASYAQTARSEQETAEPPCKSAGSAEGVLSGQLLTAAGKPASNVKVFIEDENGKAKITVSSSRGCFLFKGVIPLAAYHVYLESDEHVFQASVRSFLSGDHMVIREGSMR